MTTVRNTFSELPPKTPSDPDQALGQDGLTNEDSQRGFTTGGLCIGQLQLGWIRKEFTLTCIECKKEMHKRCGECLHSRLHEDQVSYHVPTNDPLRVSNLSDAVLASFRRQRSKVAKDGLVCHKFLDSNKI